MMSHNGTAEGSADEARRALAAADHAHAAHHLALALSHDPNQPQWLDLLRRLLDDAAEPLAHPE